MRNFRNFILMYRLLFVNTFSFCTAFSYKKHFCIDFRINTVGKIDCTEKKNAAVPSVTISVFFDIVTKNLFFYRAVRNGFVILSESGQSVDDRQHFPSQFRKSVFYPRGQFMVVPTINKPILRHLTQTVGQHFLRYSLKISLKFVKSPRPRFQVA